MNARAGVILAVRTLVVSSLALIPAQLIAAPLILNGGFESDLTSWEPENQPGSFGTFAAQSTGFSVPPPPEGVFAAIKDLSGGGSHVLYQDFVVPTGFTTATLSFDLFINSFEPFVAPQTLDFSPLEANQQARVDLLVTPSDPFSVDAADVLLTLYQTDPTDPQMAGWFTTTLDLTSLLMAHAGEMLRLRFAEVDNINFFILGVDNVRLEATTAVPEPASFALLGVGALALIARRHHSRRA